MSEDEKVYELGSSKAAVLMARLMLAWDGQWFLKTAESCGLQKAVEINAKVRKSFGRIEMREYLKALGVDRAASLEEAAHLLDGYGRLFLGDGLKGEWKINGEQGAVIDVTKCLPQEGAAKAGLQNDTPCVACERLWSSWLEALLPGSCWEAKIEKSMGRGADFCRIAIKREG